MNEISHCVFAFDAVLEYLELPVTEPIIESFCKEKFPLFVTWKKRTSPSSEWRLRGCIGTFAPKDLSSGLKEYAIFAAFQDSRFTPIISSELPSLKVDVSLLTRFTPCKHAKDWEIGKHGIILEYTASSSSRSYNATYLPEVAKEQGWTQEETLRSLLQKAGYYGTVDKKLFESPNLTLQRYESSKAEMTWADYLSWKTEQKEKNVVQGSSSSATIIKRKRISITDVQEDELDEVGAASQTALSKEKPNRFAESTIITKEKIVVTRTTAQSQYQRVMKTKVEE